MYQLLVKRAGGRCWGVSGGQAQEEEVDRRHARRSGVAASACRCVRGPVEGQRNGKRVSVVNECNKCSSKSSVTRSRPAIQSNAEAAAIRYFSIFGQSRRLHLCMSARLPACEQQSRLFLTFARMHQGGGCAAAAARAAAEAHVRRRRRLLRGSSCCRCRQRPCRRCRR